MLPGWCCIANRHIRARERRQLIPHVRFQVPFLGPESQLKSGFACAGLLWHVQQMCALMGLNKRLQSKKTPGHSDMDLQDRTGELSPDLAKKFRTCVGILLYLASDLPHAQHVVRHLATYSTAPTQKSLVVLKHLVSYLACHEDVCISLKWRGRNAGVFHQYEVFTDSGWASDKTSRRSVSCATMFVGGCLLFSSSRTQKLVSLSSAEAEVCSCSSGASDAIMLSRLSMDDRFQSDNPLTYRQFRGERDTPASRSWTRAAFVLPHTLATAVDFRWSDSSWCCGWQHKSS